MKILLLGGGGQLGRDLGPLLERRGHQVVAPAHDRLDICEEGAVAGLLAAEGVRRVVNCAAYTNVDRAEAEPERADRVNRLGAQLVANACALAGVPLCHLSTDFVFGGAPYEAGRAWAESDPPHPLGVYASTKRAGELACLESGAPLFLVRTSWLYGNRGPNFPLTILRAARRGGVLRVVDDQVGAPTWTMDLADALERLLKTEAFGTYHLSGGGQTSWFGFARSVLDQVGLTTAVIPVSTRDWGAPAPRPSFSVLRADNWRHLGEPPLPDWEDALRRYLGSEPAVTRLLADP